MFIIVPVGDENPTKHKPVVNYLLLAANLIIFFYFFLLHPQQYADVIEKYALVPGPFLHAPVEAIFSDGWRLVTSLFLHGGLSHVIGNMLFLYIAGDNVEEKFGHILYLLFYLFAGVIANAAHIVMSAGIAESTPVLGASGAIAGVLGAYVIWFPKRRIRLWYLFIIFIGSFTVPSLYVIGLWFLQQLYLGQLTKMAGASTGVAYWAHIGGFVFGSLIALASRTAGALDQHLGILNQQRKAK